MNTTDYIWFLVIFLMLFRYDIFTKSLSIERAIVSALQMLIFTGVTLYFLTNRIS
jgi:hypothetical protein